MTEAWQWIRCTAAVFVIGGVVIGSESVWIAWLIRPPLPFGMQVFCWLFACLAGAAGLATFAAGAYVLLRLPHPAPSPEPPQSAD